MAIASILHRISGVILFLFLPVLLFILSISLQSEEGFAQMKSMLAYPGYQFVLWAFSSALVYHVLAGFRHILMDMGVGEQLSSGRRSAVVVIVLGVIATIFLGIWIW